MSSDFVMSARSTWLFPPVRGVLPELLLLKGFHRWKLFTMSVSAKFTRDLLLLNASYLYKHPLRIKLV